MTEDEALRFLSEHQPLPPTAEIDERMLAKFDEVLRFFEAHPDPRCIPLILRAFGEGDGHGVYQTAEAVLMQFEPGAVVPHLKECLITGTAPVRCWAAQFSMRYRSGDLAAPLSALAESADMDTRCFAIAALAINEASWIVPRLHELKAQSTDPELIEWIDEVVKGRDAAD